MLPGYRNGVNPIRGYLLRKERGLRQVRLGGIECKNILSMTIHFPTYADSARALKCYSYLASIIPVEDAISLSTNSDPFVDIPSTNVCRQSHMVQPDLP